MALDEPGEDEQSIPVNGLDLLISDEVKPYVSGNVLDWAKGFMREGFVIRPEQGGSCC